MKTISKPRIQSLEPNMVDHKKPHPQFEDLSKEQYNWSLHGVGQQSGRW